MAGLLTATAWIAAGVAAAVLACIHKSILRSHDCEPIGGERALIGLSFALAAVATAGGVVDPTAGAAIGAGLSAALVAVSLDLRLGLVPDIASAIIAIAGLGAAQNLNPGLDWIAMALGAATGAGVLALAGVYMKVRRGAAGLGAGDVLLAAAFGLWCGPHGAALAVAASAAVTLLAALATGKGASDRLAFAPGLAAGFIGVITWTALWLA